MGTVDAPESLDGQFFGRRRVADNAQNPAVHRALMLAKQRFESLRVPLPKKVQDAARSVPHLPFPLLPILTARHKKGYTQWA
jgi:hypothetical protein